MVVIDGLGKAKMCASLVERRLGWRKMPSRGAPNFDRTTLPVMRVTNIHIMLDGTENGLNGPPTPIRVSQMQPFIVVGWGTDRSDS